MLEFLVDLYNEKYPEIALLFAEIGVIVPALFVTEGNLVLTSEIVLGVNIGAAVAFLGIRPLLKRE